MGVWEHLGGQFLHGHAEWVETRDLILGNFDSRLSYGPLKLPPYVCIGSHAFAMFSAHALREGRGHARTST